MSSPRRGHRSAVALRRLSSLVAAALVLVVLPATPAAAAPVRVMPLGDSITDGYEVPGGYRIDLEELLVADGLPVDSVGSLSNGPASLDDRDHESHRGWQIDQLTDRVDGWLASSRPDVVLLTTGTNDSNRAYRVDTAPQRMSRLNDRPAVDDGPGRHARPLDGGEREQRIRTSNAALSGVVRDQVRRGRDVQLADVHAALTVRDLAGPDRYATAARAAEVFWPRTSDVDHLATGQAIPDALAGVPAAGRDSAPLLLVEPGCVPAVTARALERLRPTTTVVLGGTATVSRAAADGEACGR